MGLKIVLDWINRFEKMNGNLPSPDEIKSQIQLMIDYEEQEDYNFADFMLNQNNSN